MQRTGRHPRVGRVPNVTVTGNDVVQEPRAVLNRHIEAPPPTGSNPAHMRRMALRIMDRVTMGWSTDTGAK